MIPKCGSWYKQRAKGRKGESKKIENNTKDFLWASVKSFIIYNTCILIVSYQRLMSHGTCPEVGLKSVTPCSNLNSSFMTSNWILNGKEDKKRKGGKLYKLHVENETLKSN